jgi:hypothetical protein
LKACISALSEWHVRCSLGLARAKRRRLAWIDKQMSQTVPFNNKGISMSAKSGTAEGVALSPEYRHGKFNDLQG